jgi:hypothetical protein
MESLGGTIRAARLRPAMAVAAALIVAGCGSDDKGQGGGCKVDESYDPAVQAADFSTTVDNPLMPLVPGTKTTFDGGGEHIEVAVTDQTRVVMGVTCVVVRDTVTVDGEVAEDTFDWYAQDKEGNLWYFGEDSKEYDGGKVISTEGSWEAGVDGAKPGIAMLKAQPPAGEPYRQEYLACEAEDFAEVVSLDEPVTVPYGSFEHCLKTREFTPLEPDVEEHKYYCEGVGLVLEVDEASGARVELTAVSPPLPMS